MASYDAPDNDDMEVIKQSDKAMDNDESHAFDNEDEGSGTPNSIEGKDTETMEDTNSLIVGKSMYLQKFAFDDEGSWCTMELVVGVWEIKRDSCMSVTWLNHTIDTIDDFLGSH